MSAKLRWLPLVACSFITGGCADTLAPGLHSGPRPGHDLELTLPSFVGSAGTVPKPGSTDLRRTFTVAPPEGVPPEFSAPVDVISVRLILGFTSLGTSKDASAWAFMNYLATHAEQSLTVSLTYEQSQMGSLTQTSQESSLVPGERDLVTRVHMPVSKDCGHTAIASSQSKAWNETVLSFGLLAWGHQNVPMHKSESQPSCVPETPAPPTGGDAGGGGLDPKEHPEEEPKFYDCYYSYLYDPDTGRVTDVFNVFCFPA